MFAKQMIRCSWLVGIFALALVLPGLGFAADEPAKPSEKATVEQLAQARQMVHGVLDTWDFRTWNQLLAEDVTVKFMLGSVGKNAEGNLAALGADLEVKGREDAKKLLKQVYGDLKKETKIIGEVAYGYDVILLGALSVTSSDGKPQSLPITCFMHFNPKGKIEKLVLAGVDTRPLTEAIKK
jgi:hypothetical protein